MAESKSAALPLGYAPTMRLSLRSRGARTIAAPAQASNTRAKLAVTLKLGLADPPCDWTRDASEQVALEQKPALLP
jgi:hypothetical protein